MFSLKFLASSISASFKVLEFININRCKPTVFSLLFLHYEWHHITLGCRVMMREQCGFDELCMKALLSILRSFHLGKARLLKAILMCAFVRPLSGCFWLLNLKFTNSVFVYKEQQPHKKYLFVLSESGTLTCHLIILHYKQTTKRTVHLEALRYITHIFKMSFIPRERPKPSL